MRAEDHAGQPALPGGRSWAAPDRQSHRQIQVQRVMAMSCRTCTRRPRARPIQMQASGTSDEWETWKLQSTVTRRMRNRSTCVPIDDNAGDVVYDGNPADLVGRCGEQGRLADRAVEQHRLRPDRLARRATPGPGTARRRSATGTNKVKTWPVTTKDRKKSGEAGRRDEHALDDRVLRAIRRQSIP